jgi:hypothetical protein
MTPLFLNCSNGQTDGTGIILMIRNNIVKEKKTLASKSKRKY